ncbi:hypothetical protein [Brevundimonas sp.]|uniref:hypothetical protein n=1 Tax=Brevundimonas sp. TaxID=1871086 RepID=UPI003F70C1D4
MTDITIQRSDKGKRAGKKPKGVTLRRVTAANGEKVTIRAIDANSPTFGEDLLYVFSKNVEAARRENKALLGSPSGAPKRGG